MAATACSGTEDSAGGHRDGGVESVRRATASSLEGSLQELLRIEVDLSNELPADPLHGAFDNQLAALRFSPGWLIDAERAFSAAVERAVDTEINAARRTVQPAMYVRSVGGEPSTGDEGLLSYPWALGVNDAVRWTFSAELSGTYSLSLRYFGSEFIDEHGVCEVRVDGLKVADAPAPALLEWKTVASDVSLAAGDNVISFECTGGSEVSAVLDVFTLEGPAAHPLIGVSPRRGLLPCAALGEEPDDDCARQALVSFTARAWEAAGDDASFERPIALYDELRAMGEGSMTAFKSSIVAVLLSPQHLNHVYRRWTDTGAAAAKQFAHRVALLFWNRPADAALVSDVVASGVANLDAGSLVREMLDDPRASDFVETFVSQWLGLNWIRTVSISEERFPAFNADLRHAMREELLHLVRGAISAESDLRQLLTSTEAFVTPELAALYDVESTGEGATPVELDPHRRAGIHTRAGILAALSNPQSTHPTRRGHWVLDRLLCSSPPPPPANIPPLAEPSAEAGLATGRDRTERHLSDGNCISCHIEMDTIGLTLENFDAIGRWRDEENGVTIDASGSVPEWGDFAGGVDLGRRIAEDPRFASCVTEQLFTYVFGATPTEDEADEVAELTRAFVASEYRLVALLTALIESPRFTGAEL